MINNGFASKKQLLENFITSPELVELETRFGTFNIFEAMGVVRREIYHSSFLAFLLDPSESHGLRDLFLRRFLQEAVKSEQSATQISAVDFDLLDLIQCEVRREHENIDILVHDPRNNIVVIIENKVDSQLHSDQLTRYHNYATSTFPNHSVFGIFLTREGDESPHDSYIKLSYSTIRQLINEVLARQNVLLSSTVRSGLEQYADLLGRHLMADQDLQQLCIKIYKRHKQAIDIILDNIPDEREALANQLKELILSAGFVLDDCNANYVRFLTPSLDLPYFKGAEGWTSSKRLVLFEFRIGKDSLVLIIQMGPGDASKRERIHQFALSKKPLFCPEKKLYAAWQRLYKFPILNASDYDVSSKELLEKVKEKWQDFVSNSLPAIEKAVLSQTW